MRTEPASVRTNGVHRPAERNGDLSFAGRYGPGGLRAVLKAVAETTAERDPAALKAIADERDRRDRRDRRVSGDGEGDAERNLGEALVAYLTDYVHMPRPTAAAVTAWVMASWLSDLWDRFGHLGITSILEGCGKTRLLELLLQVCRNAELTVSVSSASIYRMIETGRPTLLHDEAQGLIRPESEFERNLYNLFCGSISKDAMVRRCAGQEHESKQFPSYCPKVVALIGGLPRAMADRCLPILLRRITRDETVKRARMKDIEEGGTKLRDRLTVWFSDPETCEKVTKAYAETEPFDISSHRMAELLVPLQAVLAVESPGLLGDLKEFALGLDRHKHDVAMCDPGLRLLIACREFFGEDVTFLPTKKLINLLMEKEGDGWSEINRGRAVNNEKIAFLLKPYGIKSDRNREQTARGYHRAAFVDAWERWLPPLPGDSSNPATSSTPSLRPAGYDAMIRTPRWFIFTRRVRAHWGGRCAVCHSDGPLQVHHRTYERFGREEMTDVLPLCRECHRFADAARKEARS
jgi:hypothetical protein